MNKIYVTNYGDQPIKFTIHLENDDPAEIILAPKDSQMIEFPNDLEAVGV